MKKFLCYDTNDAASGKINVDNRGMLKPNSTVPSTNGAPYQQLVTDGSGNTQWEDRLAYVEQAFQKITYDSYEEITFNNNNKGTYEGQFPVNISNSGCPDGTKLKISLDGTEYITNVIVLTEGGYTFRVTGNFHFINPDAPDTGEPFYAVMSLANEVSEPGQSICQLITTLSGDKHTVKIFLAGEIVNPVDEKFIPDIPVEKLPNIPADKLPNIPADKLPDIPAHVIEVNGNFSDSIENSSSPLYTVKNLNYSEILSIFNGKNFAIKDNGYYYRPIKFSISTRGDLFVQILVNRINTSSGNMVVAELCCNNGQDNFYRNNYWTIAGTKH